MLQVPYVLMREGGGIQSAHFQVRSADLAQLEQSDITPMILRSLVAGRPFSRLPFLCQLYPVVQLHAKERMLMHGVLDNKSMTRMGQAVACMDLRCDWAQFLHSCRERGLEDGAIVIIATWYREGPAMTHQFYMNHGHPDGDLITSLLASRWFEETRTNFRNQRNSDWKTGWNKDGRLALRLACCTM